MRRLVILALSVLLTLCPGLGCGRAAERSSDSNSAAIRVQVHRIVADQIGVDMRALKDSHTFYGDLKCDDLDTVELIMSFEDDFGISIPDAEAESFETIGDVVTYLTRRSAK